MAEASSKTGILARAQKRLSRTKTKVLQNLGKAERTTDEQFDELVIKLERQQESAHHLQKELKKYLHALEALSTASKSFYSAVEETYEAEWTEEKNFRENLKASETLWVDYLSRLHDKVVDPMVAYQASFPTLKAKINKRGRKLMYYDNAKHSVDVIQMAKKKDEAKVHKAHEDLSNAKQIYQRINNELLQELPDFHNSRVTFYAQLFGDLFDIENTFHGEIAKIADSEAVITTDLKKDYKDFVYTPKRPISKAFSNEFLDNTYRSDEEINGHNSFDETAGSSSFSDSNPNSPVKINGGENIYTNQEVINSTLESKGLKQSKVKEEGSQEKVAVKKEEPAKVEEAKAVEEIKVNGAEDVVKVNGAQEAVKVNGADANAKEHSKEDQPDIPDYPPPKPPAEDNTQTTPSETPEDHDDDINVYDEPKSPKPKEEEKEEDKEEKEEESNKDEKPVYKSPASNQPVKEAPPNLLYQVQATHPYHGEDVDELTFDTGEIIWVIPYENVEEQDDGWVMGIKQSDGVKGVFPENFTRKLET